MAAVTAINNIVIMENGDTYSPLTKKIAIQGVRLIGDNTNASTGSLSTDKNSNAVIYALACQGGECDESSMCVNADADVLTATVTGTGAYLMVYLK